MMFGLLERDINYIIKGLCKFTEIDQAKIFGSRALGNYKSGSDVDIALLGQEITDRTIDELSELLNEVYPLPYFFDILHYSALNNQKLKEHIDTVGIEFYRRNS
ncbi:nucleotidyltransferase family protein [Alkalihalobacterium alkalinitrilicum]|uniref:nucleotidyltransferase family protein n=1 Tax=Alkalihalobacterium alkalinitrilicum TaxID=427920 RepID=UPI001EE4C798|nr:nucleotidyltransferase domain-containing protein [Alkalihalobacterium alkalinitrilicum]